jgi:hypothetical protein
VNIQQLAVHLKDIGMNVQELEEYSGKTKFGCSQNRGTFMRQILNAPEFASTLKCERPLS